MKRLHCDYCHATASDGAIGPGWTFDRHRLVWRPVHLCADYRACFARAKRRRTFVARLRAALRGGVR